MSAIFSAKLKQDFLLLVIFQKQKRIAITLLACVGRGREFAFSWHIRERKKEEISRISSLGQGGNFEDLREKGKFFVHARYQHIMNPSP